MKFKTYIPLLLLVFSAPAYPAKIVFEQNDNVVGTLSPLRQNYRRETLPPLVLVEDYPKRQTVFENGTYKQMAGQLSDYGLSPENYIANAQYVNGALLADGVLYKSDWTALRKFYPDTSLCATSAWSMDYSQTQFSPDGSLVVSIRSCFKYDSVLDQKFNMQSELMIFDAKSGAILRTIPDVRQFSWINSEEILISNSPTAPTAKDVKYYGWCSDGFNLGSRYSVEKLNTNTGVTTSLWSVVREFDSCATEQPEWIELNILPDLDYGFITHVKKEQTEAIGFRLSNGAILDQLTWAELGLTIDEHPYTYVASPTSFARVQPTDSEIRYSFFDKNGSGGFVRKISKKSWERQPENLMYLREGLLELDRKKTSAIFYKTESNAKSEVINFCTDGVPSNLPETNLLTDIHFVAQMTCPQKDGSYKRVRKIWEIK